ncbi:MAG: hypothetical protein AMXMBFR20_01110 [Planctomycetia bacterium]
MQTYTIYFPNPEDPPVSVPSAAYHYLHDVLGSVIGLVDDAGELVERYTYDPYGKVFIEEWDVTANGGNGAWAASETDCGSSTCGKLPVSSIGNPFLWTGHRYDATVVAPTPRISASTPRPSAARSEAQYRAVLHFAAPQV